MNRIAGCETIQFYKLINFEKTLSKFRGYVLYKFLGIQLVPDFLNFKPPILEAYEGQEKKYKDSI